MSDSEAIAQFSSVTGADAATASFFLDAAAGDVQQAVASFFDQGAGNSAGNSAAAAAASAAAPAADSYTGPRTLSGAPAPSSTVPGAAPAGRSAAGKPRKAARREGGIRTLRDVAGEEEEEDKEESNEYYAGGGKSGQAVQGNPRGGPPGADMPQDLKAYAEELSRKARNGGEKDYAEMMERERAAQQDQRWGGGYTLGDRERQSARVANPEAEKKKELTKVRVTFYQDGFTVDDGDLRRLDDPANKEFLADVHAGRAPREFTSDVAVELVNKMTEKYTEQPKKFAAFKGQGQSLGSTAAAPAASSAAASSAAAPASSSTPPATGVDESAPTTSLQIRLGDGSRLVAKFNPSQTVGDLRDFVRRARPDDRAFDLATTFPRQLLDDDSKTIEAAGLKGAVVVQSWL